MEIKNNVRLQISPRLLLIIIIDRCKACGGCVGAEGVAWRGIFFGKEQPSL